MTRFQKIFVTILVLVLTTGIASAAGKDDTSSNQQATSSPGKCLSGLDTDFAKQYRALKNGERKSIDINPFTRLESQRYRGIIRPKNVRLQDGCRLLVILEGKSPDAKNYNVMLNGPVKDSAVQSWPENNWVLPFETIKKVQINGETFQIGEVKVTTTAEMIFANGDTSKKHLLTGDYTVQLSKNNGDHKFSLNGPSMDIVCPDNSCYRHEKLVSFKKPEMPIEGERFTVEFIIDKAIWKNYYSTSLDIGTVHIGGRNVKNFYVNPSIQPGAAQNDVKGYNNFSFDSSKFEEEDQVILELFKSRPSRTLYIKGPKLDFAGVGQDGWSSTGGTKGVKTGSSGKKGSTSSSKGSYETTAISIEEDRVIESQTQTITALLADADSQGGAVLVVKNSSSSQNWRIKEGTTRYSRTYRVSGEGVQKVFLVNNSIKDSPSNEQDVIERAASDIRSFISRVQNVFITGMAVARATGGGGTVDDDSTDSSSTDKTGEENTGTSTSNSDTTGSTGESITPPGGTILAKNQFTVINAPAWRQYCMANVNNYNPDPYEGIDQVGCVRKIVEQCFVSNPSGDCARDSNNDAVPDVPQSVCELKNMDYYQIEQACGDENVEVTPDGTNNARATQR